MASANMNMTVRMLTDAEIEAERQFRLDVIRRLRDIEAQDFWRIGGWCIAGCVFGVVMGGIIAASCLV